MKCQWWVRGIMAVVLGGARMVQAQQGPVGVITGTITDADSKTPVSDATVIVAGTNRIARTASSGTYRIGNVPAGGQQVRVTRLGYAPLVLAATVTDGGTTNVDFALHTASTTLAQVVITGTATQNEEARANGASIGIIAVDSIPQGPVLNFSDLLSSRSPGLTILQNSGAVGSGSRIEIRGVSTTGVNGSSGTQTALNTQPVIIVDGVRAYNDIRGLSDLGGVGGQAISRFDDLDHEDIQDVQVLKGPAAAALYGTEAANGVIVIQTRHGDVASAPQWNLFGVVGSNRDDANYPANYARPLGTTLASSTFNTQANSCSLINEFANDCTAKNGPLAATLPTSYNLITNSPTFVPGYEEGAGASVNGGSPTVTYFFGANWDRQQGVYHNDQDRWTHMNVGLGIHPYEQLDLGISAQYTQRRTVLPFNDNVFGGVLTDALLGGAAPNANVLGISTPTAEQLNFNSAVDRFTLGTNGTLRVLPWLSVVGNVGVDYVSDYDNAAIPQSLTPQLTPTGLAEAASNNIFVYTGSASLNGTFKPFESLKSTTTFGGEWVDQSLRQVFGSGTGIVPGTGSLAGATTAFQTFEINQDIVDIGGYLQEQVGWRNVLFATAAGRLDGNSAFGAGKSIALYPAGNISYTVSDERYWPKNAYVSTLRFRIAAGQSGREPVFRQAQGSFAGASYQEPFSGNVSGVVPNTYGNASLKPERTSEYETGLDLGLFKERFTLTATVYDKLTTDLVQAVPVDISTGVGGGPPTTLVFTNLGKVDNRGLELSLSGTIFKVQDLVTFDMNTTFAMNRNKLINSGSALPIPIANGLTGLNLQEDVSGFPIGGFWASRFTYTMPKNGVVTPADIHYFNNGAPSYIGEQGPRDEMSFNPTVTLFRYVRVNALFDRRDGITVYDGTDDFRCLNQFQNGQDCNDPHAPAQHQAAAVALNGPDYRLTQSEYGYLLNGSFWKFRELTFKLSAPNSWVGRFLHGHSASISLSGRNLATWTAYRGLDPEINGSGPNSVANAQFFTQPPTRVWVGRLDFGW
jgi:TonB-dependent starch-binding outer membrane protein SusC